MNSSSSNQTFTWSDILVVTLQQEDVDQVKTILRRAKISFGSVEEQLMSLQPMVAVDAEDKVMSGEWSAVFLIGSRRGGEYDYVRSSRARTVLTMIDWLASRTKLVRSWSSIPKECVRCYNPDGNSFKEV